MQDTLEAVTLVIGAAFLIAAILTVPVWLLWNWVGVSVLGMPHVTILQAGGISLLSNCLFKSSGTCKAKK